MYSEEKEARVGKQLTHQEALRKAVAALSDARLAARDFLDALHGNSAHGSLASVNEIQSEGLVTCLEQTPGQVRDLADEITKIVTEARSLLRV